MLSWREADTISHSAATSSPEANTICHSTSVEANTIGSDAAIIVGVGADTISHSATTSACGDEASMAAAKRAKQRRRRANRKQRKLASVQPDVETEFESDQSDFEWSLPRSVTLSAMRPTSELTTEEMLQELVTGVLRVHD